MVQRVRARSFSRSVWERLPARSAPARVLAVFQRSCLIASAGGELLSLVPPEIGDGPLNVVVAGQPGAFGTLKPGMLASLSLGELRLGDLEVALDPARIWEPCPDWPHLRTMAAGSHGWHLRLAEMAGRQPPGSSLLAVLLRPAADRPPGRGLTETAAEGIRRCIREAEPVLRAGWAGDLGSLREAAQRLGGLGRGLTPAGDDFLAGLMLQAWLAHPEPGAFCRVVVDTAAPRTTALAASFLRAAARGECAAPWHGLLSGLDGAGQPPLEGPLRAVLAHGQTSGADMLAGLLWIPTRVSTPVLLP